MNREWTSALVALLAACSLSTARAETPAAVCSRLGTDDTLRPVPKTLAPAVNAAFATAMPPEIIATISVYRCLAGQVWVCTTGANLPCGKANQSRIPSAGAKSWCAQNPDAPMPAYVTGHDTLYEWRCLGATPTPVRQLQQVDSRGFVADYWKKLP